jgi:hypothetical protein
MSVGSTELTMSVGSTELTMSGAGFAVAGAGFVGRPEVDR